MWRYHYINHYIFTFLLHNAMRKMIETILEFTLPQCNILCDRSMLSIVNFNKTLFETKHIQINIYIYIYIHLLFVRKHNMLLYCLVGKQKYLKKDYNIFICKNQIAQTFNINIKSKNSWEPIIYHQTGSVSIVGVNLRIRV